MKVPKHIITNRRAVKQIATLLGIDTLTVSRTITAFFSYRGLKNEIRKGNTIRLRNFGVLRPSRNRKIIDRRKGEVRRITERIKKNNYNAKLKSRK